MIQFDKENHTYSKDGIYYTNVSSIVDMLSPKFDSDRIADYVAKKEGTTKELTLENWSMKGNIARNFGNAIHESIELWFRHKDKPSIGILKEAIDTFPLKDKKVFSEKVLSHDELKIAGTCDIIYTKKNKKAEIYDIKTTNDLDKSYGKLLKPLDHLKDSALNKYRIQLSIYKMMCESVLGVNVDKMGIFKWDGGWSRVDVDEIDDIEKIIRELKIETKIDKKAQEKEKIKKLTNF